MTGRVQAPEDVRGASAPGPAAVYAAWAVYGRTAATVAEPAEVTAELSSWARSLADHGVVLRGWYDVTGFRAGADLMLWLHGPDAGALQAALRDFRRTRVGMATLLTWSAIGTHRPAEFTPDHVPSFMRGAPPLAWLCVYPFVRSPEWYLLPEEDRRAMLAEHGVAGRAFAGVQPNTVAVFGLSDWEWLLALEVDDLHELVDLIRDLRATRARRHVREEVPFHTGRRIATDEVIEVLR